jgi:hypothetical protein
VIILSGLLAPRVKSLNLRTLTDVTLEEKPDRSGVITFGPQNPWHAFGGSWPGTASRNVSPMFEFIEEARSVYNRVREAQKAA